VCFGSIDYDDEVEEVSLRGLEAATKASTSQYVVVAG
jgi:hypothetical protein